MKFPAFALVTAAALAFPLASSAQAGVYATFTANRLGNIQSSPFATYANANGGTRPTVDASGGTFGVFYDYKNFGPVRLGGDFRGIVSHSNRGGANNYVGSGTHLYSVLGGIRASTPKPHFHVEPYLQLSAGLGRSDFGLATTTASLSNPYNPAAGAYELHNGVEYHIFAGADIKLFPILDFRAIELGYGGLESGSHNYPIRSVSTGVVFHLPAL